MKDDIFVPSNQYWPELHIVQNQPVALENYNSYEQDIALQHLVAQHGGQWASTELQQLGAICGSTEVIEWGFQANQHKPTLHTHSRHGQRIDEVRYHPAYHQLMHLSMSEGVHASHWETPKPGAHVARAAKFYLLSQVEAGHGCPITMTSAAQPVLRRQPELYKHWSPKLCSRKYDASNQPVASKKSVTLGMAMTEKQGGSDVRANTTRAFPMGQPGSGELYELVGHKYFVSAPMSDAFLVLAKTDAGISCFLVPRWRPDGTKNPIQIQQLKNKMGNVSNASSETELRGALGWMIGEDGRGVSVILEMAAMTRFDCMIGSAAGMRQAVAQVTHHCRQRKAFGLRLTEQPLMQNVLADLIIESEAALAFSMRMAKALDQQYLYNDEQESLLLRLGTAVGKYWICKRTPGHAYEAMECIGGSGVMEDSIMPRLFRESPVNSIWEGSGNIQCLDMLRAFHKNPNTRDALMQELELVKGAHPLLDRSVKAMNAMSQQPDIEFRARHVVETMAINLQAAALYQFGPTQMAEDFCNARLSNENRGWVYGTLPSGTDCSAWIKRATPEV